GFFGFARVVFVGVARRNRIDQVGDRVHAVVFQLGDLFFEGAVVVPAIGRARQRQAVGDQPLDHQLENAVGRLFEGAVHATVVAEPGFFDALGAFFQPVPGIFLVLTD